MKATATFYALRSQTSVHYLKMQRNLLTLYAAEPEALSTVATVSPSEIESRRPPQPP